MSSRTSIQQIVSTTAPVGAALGDEWRNPVTDKLYKRVTVAGVVNWAEVMTSNSTSTDISSYATTGSFQIGKLQLTNYGSIKALMETAAIISSAPAPLLNFDITTQSIQYYTAINTANFTLNIRGDSNQTLDSLMLVGQTLTIALMVTNGATAYYPNVFTIDGITITPKWPFGTAVTAGSVNAIDSYSITIIKTAAATFTIVASQTKFA